MPITEKTVNKLAKDEIALMLARRMFTDQAIAADIREEVDSYRDQALNVEGLEFFDDEGNKIEKVEDLYKDRDFENNAALHALVDSRLDILHRNRGFKVEAGFCPALVAEDDARKSERFFIEYCGKVLEEPALQKDLFLLGPEKYEKLKKMYLKILGFGA